MFANTSMMGMNISVPDVCLTPTPAGPVPIPYPNMSMNPTGLPMVPFVFYGCGPAHNMLTMPPMSVGDNAGVNMGVASGMVMGPTRTMLGSFTTLIAGMPATKMTSVTGQNGASLNIVGATLVPSQPRVMIMA